MKKTILIAIAFAVSFWYGCGNSEEKNHENSEGTEHAHEEGEHHEGGEHIFACPMHPEVTGKEGDTCPKCGMKLEHNDNAGKSNGDTYIMQFQCDRQDIEAGKECNFSFTPKIKGRENALVPLDVMHEKKIHLILVSNDLSYFEHIHPEYTASGAYQIKVLPREKNYSNGKGANETKFDFGGNYTLFADYMPSGATHQLEKIPITVKGNPYKTVSFSKEKLSADVDDYTVTLKSEDGKWQTNQPMHIEAVITKGGKNSDANSFENYLGAKAHMVVIKTGTYEYLHVHPEVENGNLDLHTTFESAGIYRGWLQFKMNGTVHTADFVIKVEQGNETASKQNQNEHTEKH